MAKLYLAGNGRVVARWKRALAKEQFARASRVAVLLRNSVEWVCFDQASLSLGLVVVPLYPSDAPDNIAYILADSGARLLLWEHKGDGRHWLRYARADPAQEGFIHTASGGPE